MAQYNYIYEKSRSFVDVKSLGALVVSDTFDTTHFGIVEQRKTIKIYTRVYPFSQRIFRKKIDFQKKTHPPSYRRQILSGKRNS